MRQIKLYDTTLRDGAQGEGVVFSVEDKLRVTEKLDDIGIHYIEGGWPGSNPKDIEYFKKVRLLNLKFAKVSAFSSTKKAKKSVQEDSNIQALLKSEVSVVTIFGKTWDLHVHDVLKISLEENLELVHQTISYLKGKVSEVIFDAEHFFDGFKSNPAYAIKVLETAVDANAGWIVLCDTNGGVLPSELKKILETVKSKIKTNVGIHTHNDSDMAVANTIVAVEEGVNMVQGTINGYGERCGNANLCSIIPNIQFKLKIDCVPAEKLKKLTWISRYVSEIANQSPRENMPYVGNSAFAHKAGIHVDAVKKNPKAYEHIVPEIVGNHRRILISELSGASNVVYKALEYNIDLHKDTPQTREILAKLKEMEHAGYKYEGADASFELIIRKALKSHKKFFDLEGFRVIVENRNNKLISEATIKIKVQGVFEHTAAEGDGPVNALDNALRKALEGFYPVLKSVRLTDFKVRVLDAKIGTAAKVRVIIESTDGENTWGTVGVSENIIEASWEALVDSIEFRLLKEKELKH
ncbi:MAG: citramalate synthase [Candidatus Firestonebacteria bacterium]